MRKIAKLNHFSKKELAYATIRNAIVTGELKPDERLLISELSEQLGVSEIPIREAINRLNSESFIYSQGNLHHVAPLTEQEFLDMLEVRLGLEIIAIRTAVTKIGQKGIEFQRELLRKMEASLNSNDLEQYSQLHKELHMDTFKYCGIAYLNRALIDAWDHHQRGLAVFNLHPWDTKPSLEEHKMIIDLMEKKDIRNLETFFINHRRKAFNMYFQKLKKRQVVGDLKKPEQLVF